MTTTTEDDKIEDIAKRPDPDLKLEQGQKLSARDKSALNVLVKMHFKTLMDEIGEEEQRALAEVNIRLAAERRKQASEADTFKATLDRMVTMMQGRIDDLVLEHGHLFGPGGQWQKPMRLNTPAVHQRHHTDETAARQSMVSQIRSRATTARLQVRRRETENLRAIQLAVLSAKLVETVRELPQREDIFNTADILQLNAGTGSSS